MIAARSVPSRADASLVGDCAAGPYDDGLSTFISVRPRLFGVVYRMLRSAAEAEDVVQDVWVRWQTVDHSQVRDAEAFLVTTATRLAINVMQSARSRRETYVGAWLPEPIDTSTDPESGTERREALELGVLRLLENLSPTERAAYILREAFDYPYRDIANVLRLEEANARQVVTRARRRVVNGRRISTKHTGRRRLLGICDKCLPKPRQAITRPDASGTLSLLEIAVACSRIRNSGDVSRIARAVGVERLLVSDA